MKTKLLLMFIAVASLFSCGNDDITNPEPVTPKNEFIAKYNSDEVKYVNELFEFSAFLNDVDVTEKTKFTVNGEEQKGYDYVPRSEGTYTVVAKNDTYEFTFKFDVTNRIVDQTPEKGNRIEYNGKSYPVDFCGLAIILDGNKLYTVDEGRSILWMFAAYILDDNNEPINLVHVYMKAPYNGSNTVDAPYFLGHKLNLHAGGIMTDGILLSEEISDAKIFFASEVNKIDSNSRKGNLNFKMDIKIDNTQEAKLFWNGEISYSQIDIEDISEPAAKLLKK